MFATHDLGAGVRLHHLRDRKFKRILFQAASPTALDGRVTAHALLPMVLHRGFGPFPDLRAIARETEELFGASLSQDVRKSGDLQLLEWRLNFLHPAAVAAPPGYLDRAFALLLASLAEPAGGRFRDDYVEQEKDNLRRQIEGLYNDKGSFAFQRCAEEMFPGEGFGLHPYGRVADLPALCAGDLAARHAEILREAPLEFFLIGDLEADQPLALLRERILPRRGSGPVRRPATVPAGAGGGAVRTVAQEDAVRQEKLVLGFRTPVTLRDPAWAAFGVMNGLLGGFSHSLLFRTIREKEGLAYYAFSGWERSKGVLYVGVGIDPEQREKVIRRTREIIADVAAGRFAAEDLATTKKCIVNSIVSLRDSPGATAYQFLEYGLSGREWSEEVHRAAVEAARPEEVAAAAATLELDLAFALTPARGQGGTGEEQR